MQPQRIHLQRLENLKKTYIYQIISLLDKDSRDKTKVSPGAGYTDVDF